MVIRLAILLVGALLFFIWWQARWINKLLTRHEGIYKAEIERMSETQKLLLGRVLGEQPSSQNVPTVAELKELGDGASGETKGMPQ